MVAPDGQRVAVAHRYDDVQVGPRHLDARGEGQRPSVQRVHGVEVHVPRYAGRTADAGHHDEGRGIIAQIVHAVQHGVEHVPVAAAGGTTGAERNVPGSTSGWPYQNPLPSITRMTLPMSVGVMSCPSTRLTRNTLSGFRRLPDLRHDVPHVHFHHVDVARPLGAVAHEFRRERPEGLQFQQARPGCPSRAAYAQGGRALRAARP